MINTIYSTCCIVALVLLSAADKSLYKHKAHRNYKDWLHMDLDLSDLPENIQLALHLLDNEGLEHVSQTLLPNYDIYYDLVKYFETNWDECGWPDEVAGTEEEYGHMNVVFKWHPAPEVTKNGAIAWCEIEETFTPPFNIPPDAQIPAQLLKEIEDLLDNDLQCVAMFKYQAWLEYGIVWDTQFLEQLGLEDDYALFSQFDSQLEELVPDQDTDGKDSKQNGRGVGYECVITDPIDFIAPYLAIAMQTYGDIFGNGALGNDSSICASLSWGVQVCASDALELCIGGGFGFVVCATGDAFIFRESALNIAEDGNAFADAKPKLTVEFSIYNSIDDIHGGKLTEIISYSSRSDDPWLSNPRIAFNEDNEAVGVTFIGEVRMDEGITAAAEALSSSNIDPLIDIEFGGGSSSDDSDTDTDTDTDSTTHSNSKVFSKNFNFIKHSKIVKNDNYNYLLVGALIAIGMFMASVRIKRKYYSDKLSQKSGLSEYDALLNSNNTQTQTY